MTDAPHPSGQISHSWRSVFARARSLSSLFGNGAWTLAAKIVSQAVQLAIFIAAARVMTSAEFGLYAYSSAVAMLLVVIAQGGWSEFVLKAKEGKGEHDQVATLSIVTGSLMTIVGLLIALVIGPIFGLRTEAIMIALFSCWFLPAALSAVYDAIMIVEGRLRGQAMIRITAELLAFGLILAGLWAGYSVVSLVAGRLVMQVIALFLSITALRWLPRLHLSRAFLKEILEFSRHILSNRLIIYFRSYAGTLAIGSFLGLAEAGYYRAAERIVGAFSELLGEPTRVLAWIVFRRASSGSDGDKAALGATATRFMTLLVAISAPIYLGLALISSVLIHFVLGAEWAPTALLVAVLATKQVLLIPSFVTEPLLSLTGKISKMPPAVLLNGLVAITFVLTLAPLGVHAVAFGQCAVAVISLGISVRLQGRYGGLNWKRVLRNCSYIAVAAAAMVGAVFMLGNIVEAMQMKDLPAILLQVFAGVVIYVAALALLQRITGGVIPIFLQRH